MENLLRIFIIIPLLGYLVSLCIPKAKESLIAGISIFSVGLNLISILGFITYWLFHHHPILNLKEIALYSSQEYEFFIDLYFDKISLVYALVGSFLTFLVTIYSKAYLHREPGYKRFFNTILFFYMGYCITVLSGNLETLFIGWEILGISSFLLIAFYRERYWPVKNAVKVFTIYRIGDVGILLAMWMTHHLFHSNITFIQLFNAELVNANLQAHSFLGVFISLMILITAAAKSAQLPFSSWLPRAMEGPTPSSAIFYGSLSVHLGVFLLMRTFHFWEHQYSVRVIIALLGLVTSFITSAIARVQSSIKSQVAYASISQIGLIFIEVAMGFEHLALIHFAGNAFLRTYQLLVSPSVVTYLIREQFYNFQPKKKQLEDFLPKRIHYSFYILSLKEWNLNSFMHWVLKPFKSIGRKLDFFNLKNVVVFFVSLYGIGLVTLFYAENLPVWIHSVLPSLFSFIGILMVIKSFTERRNVLLSWVLILMNHFWIALAISFNEHFKFQETLLYLSGISAAGLIGYLCLYRLRRLEWYLDLNIFHGYYWKHPKITRLFFIACLGLTGFPISPTFIGEDLIFGHIHEGQVLLAFVTASSFVLDGLSAIRIYARVFLGPNPKNLFDSHFKSS